MNWKAEAKEKLRRYGAMRTAAENIPLELKRLQLDAEGIRGAGLDMPRSKGSKRGREDALLNNLVCREELQRSLEQTKLWLDTADRGLKALSAEEKLILYSMYICPTAGNLDELCRRLEVEKSSVYRKRDKALERFTLAMYGVPVTIEN